MLFFLYIDPTPSVRTHLPLQQSTTAVRLGWGPSPFNNAPSTVKQTAQSYRLSPFHNYQPYVQSTLWHTEHTCNTRAAQPVFSPANVMKENCIPQSGAGQTPLWHESFTHSCTLVHHCDHFHFPKRPRQEEAGNLLYKAQKRTRKDHHSMAEMYDFFSGERCDKQSEEQSHSAAKTEIQEPATETALDNELEKHALKQSDRVTETNYEENEDRKRRRSSQNTTSIHYITSPKLQLSLSSTATKHSEESQRLRPEIPSRVNNFWKSMNRPDSECESRYVGTAKRCQEGQHSVLCGNENQKDIQRITCHTSCSEGTWERDRESSTMPPQKRKPSGGDSRASLKFPQQEHFDEAHRFGSQQSGERNTQLLNNWSGIDNTYRTEFGDVTQHLHEIATSKKLEKSKLPPSSKFPTEEATDVDNILLLTIPLNQNESSPQLACSAQRNQPANTVYKVDNLAENDWTGNIYDDNYLPRILAVHTIVKDRGEKTQRNELLGAKRLSPNEKKEWNRLLADLSSRGSDGYYKVEYKRSSPNGVSHQPTRVNMFDENF